MKNLTPRERIMVTLLPAGIMLIVYFIFFGRPIGDEMEKLRSDVGKAQDRAPSNQQQAEVLGKLRNLEAEVEQNRALSGAKDASGESVLAYWSDPDAKARAGEFIGNLLAANGVVLVEEAVASDEDRETFSAVLKPLPSAELWRLRLAGSYDSMRRTLTELGKTDLPLIPAGIEMEPKVEGNKSIHLWNLWICR